MPHSNSDVEWLGEETSSGWWDDEIFPRDGQFELFDALASADKQLVARPGAHGRTHPDDETSWQYFIKLNTPRTSRR